MIPEVRNVLALAFPILVAAPAVAEACPGPGYDPCAGFDFWVALAPVNAAKIPADGVLVLQGAHQGGADADWLEKIEFAVTKDGQPIAGALEATSQHGVLIWRPAAPWEPGANYHMSSNVVNPDFGGEYCAEMMIPFEASLMIDAAKGAALAPVEFTGTPQIQSFPEVTLATLACCEGAAPMEGYVGCGGTQVYWDEETCAPTVSHGYLAVDITGEAAAPGAVAGQIAYTLKVDGNVHSSGLQPAFTVYGDAPFCAVIEAEDLGSGAITLSAEQCFGADDTEVLGVHPLAIPDTLDCPLQQCAAANNTWDLTMCTPFDGAAPTTSETESDAGDSAASSEATDGQDTGAGDLVDKGCACDAGVAGDAGALALVGLVGLVGLARRRRVRS